MQRREERVDRGLCTRVRGLFFLFALLFVFVTAALLATSTRPAVLRIAGAAALLLLAVWWFTGYRRGRIPAAADPVELTALFLAAVAVTEPLQAAGLFYLGLAFRCLYSSVPAAILRGLAYPAVLLAASAVALGSPAALVDLAHAQNVAGLPMTAGVLGLIGSLLVRHEGAAKREGTLAGAGARLLGMRGRSAIIEAALEAAEDLLAPTRSSVGLALLGGSAAVRIAGVNGWREVELPVSVWAGFSDGIPTLEGDARARAVCDTLGLDPALPCVVAVPVIRHGRPAGILAAAATAAPGPGQVDALQALAAQTALALESAQLTGDLRASEARFRSLVTNAADGIVVLDEDGGITYASDATERITGHPVGSLVGTRVFDLVHIDDLATVLELFREVGSTPGTQVSVSMRLLHADSSVRVVEGVSKNLLDDPDVAGIVLNFRDVTDRHVLEEQLRHQALHDHLTGLANRALFHDRVEHALAGRDRSATLAVLFLDLDDFKTANDSLGHAAGDEVLVETARRLSASLRPADTVARIGGDEFAVLLEGGVSRSDAAGVAERILERIREPLVTRDRELHLGGSIGIACGRPGESASEELLASADIAMYIAKGRGKGRAAFFEPSMRSQVIERAQVESDLRRGIRQGEIIAHYQPILSLEDRRIVAVEALARWVHPERGILPPSQFLAHAERTGLIVPLGRHMLEEACSQGRRWQDAYPQDPPLAIAVNLSARQIHDVRIVEDVRQTLRETGLAPGSLIVEITENALIHDAPAVARKLHALKALGVRVAIDDFGTGYSSLSYLRRLPVDILKVDRSFVEGLVTSPEESVLASAIVKLGRTLRLRTVGEGIERREQCEALQVVGCDWGQGFFFTAPVAAPEIDGLLDEVLTQPAAG